MDLYSRSCSCFRFDVFVVCRPLYQAAKSLVEGRKVLRLVSSGVFKGSQARHLPRPPFSRATVEVFRVQNLLIFGENSLSTHIIYSETDHK